MNDHPTTNTHPVTTGAPQVLPAAPPPRRTVLRRPAAAVGSLAAVALGAGVLLLPGGSAAADGVGARAALQSFSLPAAHPVAPEAPEETGAAPAAPRVRDPFRPLFADSAETSLPGETSTSTSTGSDTPAFTTPTTAELPPALVPSSPTVDTGSGAGGSSQRALALTRVEPEGDGFAAVLTVDGGEPVRVVVGASFGVDLLLLSLQQGPADGQWTAVVQAGKGEPFDVVTGTPTRVP